MLRLVTWNCRIGGFWRKAEQICTLQPDVLAVQEVEPIERRAAFRGKLQPTYRDRYTDPRYPRRSIGVFSYTGLSMEAVDVQDPSLAFRRHLARRGDLTFHVASVWPYKTKIAATSYRQAHEGLREHDAWLRARPTVVLGDFNTNATYQGNAWATLMALIDSLDLVSAYHCFFKEPFGAEQCPTHFHQGKKSSPFHLDYCFIPRAWVNQLRDVRVGKYEDWRELSDHVPLIIDLNL